MHFILYCDESGRLGYSDRGENKAGEISVVAGLILHPENEDLFLRYSSSISNEFKNSNIGKFHITDLPEPSMQELREEIFGFILRNDIPVVYGAIYHEALARQFKKRKAENNSAAAELKKEGLTISKNLTQFMKLSQAESFYCMYVKAACTLISQFKQPIKISVITDEVDDKTLKSYQEQIERLHKPNSRPGLKGKRFNKKTSEIEEFNISVTTEGESERDCILKLSMGKVFKQNTGTSIVADVIANSIHHHLQKTSIETSFGPLNSYEAIKNHPLNGQIIAPHTNAFDKIHPYTGASLS